MSRQVNVVPTGTANLASVVAGLTRVGADVELVSDPAVVERSHRVVVPGVGSFGAAIGQVDRAGLRQALRERLAVGRPTLAICVGMQLLATKSEESDGRGLGAIESTVRRFPDAVRVPQLGWNLVEAERGCRLVTHGWAYFANSYRIETVPDGWSGAMADHGGPFVAAMERGSVLACQFHPELSGSWGSQLLRRWLESGGPV